MSADHEALFAAGVALAEKFCAANAIPMPGVQRLARTDRLFHLATCAYYRPTTITIMVEKCACRGYGGRAWSWPGYTVDRTPYGVVQHELGHHLDNHFFKGKPAGSSTVFSWGIWEQSKEEPLTGYLGTDKRELTFYMEWFAEIFRLFVTNPDLCRLLRPRFFAAVTAAGLKPVVTGTWREVLAGHSATDRITEQAAKKISAVPQELFA